MLVLIKDNIKIKMGELSSLTNQIQANGFANKLAKTGEFVSIKGHQLKRKCENV